MVRSTGGGGSSTRDRSGWSTRDKLQCQICNRVGHFSQRCYYRYSRPVAPTALPVPWSVVSSLPLTLPRTSVSQRPASFIGQQPQNAHSNVNDRDFSNLEWAPLPRQIAAPCANNVEYQGVTI